MNVQCIGNCITCGKCAKLPILESFGIKHKKIEPREGFGIAVDIGTTTVVIALVNLTDGNITAVHSFMNPLRVFGPDVISRINAANNGFLNEMQRMITKSVTDGIAELNAPGNIIETVIAGNTTMTYIYLGYPNKSLGVSPFIPKFKPPERAGGVHILPWLAAFVGGDITAGLLFVSALGKQRFILADLGTNGEMALYNNGALTVTSTAAGPAFETCLPGVGTSGVISELAKLVRGGIVDETGLLTEDSSVFTQKQIRDLQLAKSAVRTGLEILLKSADVEAVYLAGGFGQAMDINDAADIGLIPRSITGITHAVGNTSLGGAVSVLLTPSHAEREINKLLKISNEINLATHPNFNELFMEHMYF